MYLGQVSPIEELMQFLEQESFVLLFNVNNPKPTLNFWCRLAPMLLLTDSLHLCLTPSTDSAF